VGIVTTDETTTDETVRRPDGQTATDEMTR